MKEHIIFLHGGGSEEDYEADAMLVTSLKESLGAEYYIHYPFLPDDGTPDLGRRRQISQEISLSRDNVIVVAHSLGASMFLAWLSEIRDSKKIASVFLLATPYWSGDENWVQPFKPKRDFATHLDTKIPLHFYHCLDDDEVPFDHLNMYRQEISWASYKEIANGGHQFSSGLTLIAADIKSIKK